MSKKTQNGISDVVKKKKMFPPVLKSPTKIGFIGVNKMGRNLTLGYLKYLTEK
jgi:hypothetical protein